MRKQWLDILKFIASLFIVLIHVPLPGMTGAVLSGVARFGVPLFFMVSGYFSYKVIENKDYNKIRKRIIHLVKIFIISFLCYAVGYIVLNHSLYNDEWFVLLKDVSTYLKILLFNFPFAQEFVHLWFILALIYVYAVLILVLKLHLERFIKFTPVIIIITALFFNVVLGKLAVEVTPMLGRNFLMMGLPLFSIGYLVKKYGNDIKKPKQLIIAGLISGIVLFTFEFKFLCNNSELYLGMVLVAVSLFAACVYFDKSSMNKVRLIGYLGDISLYVYILHNLVNRIVYYVFIDSGMQTGNAFAYIRPFLVMLISVVISVIIMLFKKLFIKRKAAKANVC